MLQFTPVSRLGAVVVLVSVSVINNIFWELVRTRGCSSSLPIDQSGMVRPKVPAGTAL